MDSEQSQASVNRLITEANKSSEALATQPKDYIAIEANPELTLARLTIFGQDKPLASIDFDADQLDILISRMVAVRDAMSGRK
ncbi:hypothetical protein ACMDCR_27445 [Labrys okinawensis]|uniref:hypothetical protein n=1 Tax=Labrys okinawensis TaxID=346911 RepID=UPI0039BC8098